MTLRSAFVETADNSTSTGGKTIPAPATNSSPTLTGVPIAPTASPLTNSVQISTTGYTDAAVAVEAARAIAAEATKAPSASPVFTGVVQTKRLNVHGGTALIAGNIALSSGWGTSPTLVINRGVDQAASIQITAKATVAANPTVTVTFADGTFTQVPVVVVSRTDISSPTGSGWSVTSVTATAVVFTFVGLPVANSTYGFCFICMGT